MVGVQLKGSKVGGRGILRRNCLQVDSKVEPVIRRKLVAGLRFLGCLSSEWCNCSCKVCYREIKMYLSGRCILDLVGLTNPNSAAIACNA